MRDASDEMMQQEPHQTKALNRKHKHSESLNSHFDGGAKQNFSSSIVSNGEVIEQENLAEEATLEGDRSQTDTTPGKQKDFIIKKINRNPSNQNMNKNSGAPLNIYNVVNGLDNQASSLHRKQQQQQMQF